MADENENQEQGNQENEGTGQEPDNGTEGQEQEQENGRQEKRDENTRSKLKAAEERVAQYRTAEAESVASEWLSFPPDLWMDNSLESLLTDDGELDAEKVKEAVSECVKRRPHTSKVGSYHKEPDGSWTFLGGHSPAFGGGYGNSKNGGNPGWSDILAGRNK